MNNVARPPLDKKRHGNRRVFVKDIRKMRSMRLHGKTYMQIAKAAKVSLTCAWSYTKNV